MGLNSLDKVGLAVVILIFWLAGIIATFIFLENKQTNESIGKCVSETKDHFKNRHKYLGQTFNPYFIVDKDYFFKFGYKLCQ